MHNELQSWRGTQYLDIGEALILIKGAKQEKTMKTKFVALVALMAMAATDASAQVLSISLRAGLCWGLNRPRICHPERLGAQPRQ